MPHFFPIALSFLAAFWVTLLPLPSFLGTLEPPWILLTLIYWTIAFPHRIGFFTAWTVGIFYDCLQGNLFGESAIAFILVAYFIIRFAEQLRMFPIWQASLAMTAPLLMYQIVVFWIEGFLRHPPKTWVYWLPCVTGAVFWPLIFSMLRGWRRYCKIY
ncbi:MAG: rod shape-determining protein MreD [Gammaproteobacteria bacterium]|nr:rod shape-determining protein MreD [Gammaproteobacteria bacterium]